MKNKQKKNKYLVIILITIVVVGMIVFFAFFYKKDPVTLSCDKVESNEHAQLSTRFLIEKTGNEMHLNYTGKIEFFTENEFAKKFLTLYVKNQVEEIKEVNETFVTYNELENQISYEFNFNMNDLSEEKIKTFLGIYTEDMEELKKHFENGGLVCEES